MRVFRLLVLFSLPWFFVGKSAGQCDCMEAYPPLLYEEAEFVAAGRVTRIEKEKDATKYQVQIEEIFRGQEKQQTVAVYDDAGSCNVSLQTGRLYPILARKGRVKGSYHLRGCLYTFEIEGWEQVFIEYFRWRKSKDRSGGILLGMVWQPDENKQTPPEVSTVFLKSENGTVYETKIEAEGFYKFTGLPAGSYKVFLKLPDTLIAASGNGRYLDMDEPAPQFVIGSTTDSAAVFRYFSVNSNGRISGRVFDSEGAPVSGIKVTLYSLTDPQKQGEEGDEPKTEDETETDYSGSYSFRGLPPGRYLIKAGDDGKFLDYPSTEAAYLAAYFPSAKTEKEAEVITLSKAQVLTNMHVTSLPKLKKRIITGQIIWPDGRPAPHAKIVFRAKRGHQQVSGWYSNSGDTDGQGNISLEAYEDTEYLLKAQIDKPIHDVVVEVTHSSQCVAIPANGPVKPIKLTLKPGDKNCQER